MSMTEAIPDRHILIEDSIDVSRRRIREAEESGLITRSEPWHISSYTVEAIYKGPEVITDTNLVSIRCDIPERLNFAPHIYASIRNVSFIVSAIGVAITIIGVVEIAISMGDDQGFPEISAKARKRGITGVIKSPT